MDPSLTAGACFDLIEHGLRRARDIELARQMVNLTFLDDWLRRRCQLCAKQYTAEPLPPRQVIDRRPRLCPDCTIGLERAAASVSEQLEPQRLHQPIKAKSSAAVAMQRIIFGSLYPRGLNGFTYGRPWQDHVPTRNRHLIGEKP